MTSKIFRNSFLVGVAVFFLSIALFMGVLYQYFGSQLLIQLESEAALAARGVEMGSMDYLDGLSSANRITWIDAGGTVLFDNQADPAQMENHADREEVRAALESETGTASRYSTTLSQRTLYFAQRLADGTVLRVSSEQRSLPSLLLSMVQPILIILVLAVALAAVLVYRLAQLESFGVPYLTPFAASGDERAQGHGVIRWPTHWVKFRERALGTQNQRRQG